MPPSPGLASRPGAVMMACALLASEGEAARPANAAPAADGLGADSRERSPGRTSSSTEAPWAATGVMAFGGADQAIRVGVQQNVVAPAYADASLYAGYLLPVLVAPGVYLAGLAVHDRKTAGAGSAAVQALVVAIVATAVLKVGVGACTPSTAAIPARRTGSSTPSMPTSSGPSRRSIYPRARPGRRGTRRGRPPWPRRLAGYLSGRAVGPCSSATRWPWRSASASSSATGTGRRTCWRGAHRARHRVRHAAAPSVVG